MLLRFVAHFIYHAEKIEKKRKWKKVKFNIELQVECKKAQPKEVMMPQAQKNTRLNQAILVQGGPTPAFG